MEKFPKFEETEELGFPSFEDTVDVEPKSELSIEDLPILPITQNERVSYLKSKIEDLKNILANSTEYASEAVPAFLTGTGAHSFFGAPNRLASILGAEAGTIAGGLETQGVPTSIAEAKQALRAMRDAYYDSKKSQQELEDKAWESSPGAYGLGAVTGTLTPLPANIPIVGKALEKAFIGTKDFVEVADKAKKLKKLEYLDKIHKGESFLATKRDIERAKKALQVARKSAALKTGAKAGITGSIIASDAELIPTIQTEDNLPQSLNPETSSLSELGDNLTKQAVDIGIGTGAGVLGGLAGYKLGDIASSVAESPVVANLISGFNLGKKGISLSKATSELETRKLSEDIGNMISERLGATGKQRQVLLDAANEAGVTANIEDILNIAESKLAEASKLNPKDTIPLLTTIQDFKYKGGSDSIKALETMKDSIIKKNLAASAVEARLSKYGKIDSKIVDGKEYLMSEDLNALGLPLIEKGGVVVEGRSPQAMQIKELQALKSQVDNYSQNFIEGTNQKHDIINRRIATELSKGIRDAENKILGGKDASKEILAINNEYNKLMETKSILGIDNINTATDLGKDELQTTIANYVKKAGSDAISPDENLAKRLYDVPALKGKAEQVMERLHQTRELNRLSGLGISAQESTESAVKAGFGGTASLAAKVGNVAGKLKSHNLSRKLIGSSPEYIDQLANRIAKRGNIKLAEQLRSFNSFNDSKRKAALFTLLQNGVNSAFIKDTEESGE